MRRRTAKATVCRPSLPSRERGLKSNYAINHSRSHPSLPSRERGLKLLFRTRVLLGAEVAPFAGAWIEI